MKKIAGNTPTHVILDDVPDRPRREDFENTARQGDLAVGWIKTETGARECWRLDAAGDAVYRIPKLPGATARYGGCMAEAMDMFALVPLFDDLLQSAERPLKMRIGLDADLRAAIDEGVAEARQLAERANARVLEANTKAHLADEYRAEAEAERDQLQASLDKCAAETSALWVQKDELREERDFHKGRADDLAAEIERDKARLGSLRGERDWWSDRCQKAERRREVDQIKAGLAGFAVCALWAVTLHVLGVV